MDDSYQAYINRVTPQTVATAYEQQLANAQASPKFADGQAVPFAGYSLITPTYADDLQNGEFYERLKQVQQQVSTLLKAAFIPLSEKSLHLTIADLIWDGPYEDCRRQNPDFESLLIQHVQHSFADYVAQYEAFSSCQWQVFGLLVLPRSLGVVLVPQREADYLPPAQLRRTIYQNSNLIHLGIEQQYRYTAHITLGYFDSAIEQLSRDEIPALSQQFCAINDQWLESKPLTLTLDTVQLRQFTDMTDFRYLPHYPALKA